MPRVLLTFLGISVQAGLYYYVWRRLVRDTHMPAPWRRRLSAVILAGAVSLPIVIVIRTINPALGRAVGWPAFAMLAITALTFSALLLFDSGRLASWVGRYAITRRGPEPVDMQRRVFMHRVAGGSAALSALSLAGHGTYEALKTPGIARRSITLDRLPPSMHGFTIAQITDLHIGHTIEESFVRGVVDAANAISPDLIVLTGDMIDGTVDALRQHAAPLADLRARHGVYFVTGNHEYYSGADAWIAHWQELGIRVLRNEHVAIGDAQASFDLAGVDDYRAARYAGHGPDLVKALAGRDPSRELILLAHQPVQIFESMKHDVGLQLSGHTHGGQIWPWHYIARISQRGLLAGHSWHGRSQLYISRGTGYWGPPVRVFAKSEITQIILRARAS